MPDCHVETYVERWWRQASMAWRARVILTASGRVLYETWPYRSETSAIDRARRWILEERRRVELLRESWDFFGEPLFREPIEELPG